MFVNINSTLQSFTSDPSSGNAYEKFRPTSESKIHLTISTDWVKSWLLFISLFTGASMSISLMLFPVLITSSMQNRGERLGRPCHMWWCQVRWVDRRQTHEGQSLVNNLEASSLWCLSEALLFGKVGTEMIFPLFSAFVYLIYMIRSLDWRQWRPENEARNPHNLHVHT